MAISLETIKQELDLLTSDQLQQIADFIAFLRFRDKRRQRVLDPENLALLANEFAEEDRTLAEEGINDYAVVLAHEDNQAAHRSKVSRD